MSSAAATSLISTPDRLLSCPAVALNRSPYLATLRGSALATTHLQAVSPRCQLNRGTLGVGVGPAVRPHQLVNLIVPMIRNRDFWVGSRSFGLREDGSRPMLDRVFISTRTMYMNPLLWNINNPLTESSCFPFFGLRRKTCPSGIFTTAK